MKEHFDWVDDKLPAWRMSVFQVLLHKDGKSTKTGEYEIVLGRDGYVVSAKGWDMQDIYVEALDKAFAIEEKLKKKDV